MQESVVVRNDLEKDISTVGVLSNCSNLPSTIAQQSNSWPKVYNVVS